MSKYIHLYNSFVKLKTKPIFYKLPLSAHAGNRKTQLRVETSVSFQALITENMKI